MSLLRSKKLGLIVLIFSSLFFVCYLFGDNLKAKWWYVDDHEIMMFLGKDRKLNINEIPNTLIEKTEVGKFGKYERFRPSYYALRLIETSLWGDNSNMWYLTRLLILTSFLAILWYLIWEMSDYVKGLIFVIITLSATYWAELIGRLGPGESYVVLGLGIYILSYYKIWKKFFTEEKSGKNLWYILLVLGGIIAIGSKENALILIIPSLILLLISLFKKKDRAKVVVSTAIILTYAFLVGSSIILAISKSNSDIYGDTVGIKDLILLTLKSIPSVLSILRLQFVTPVVIGFCVAIFKLKGMLKGREYLRKEVLIFYFTILGIVILYLSQIFFYKGMWPTGMRYDFPGLLYIPIYIFSLLIFIIQSLKYLDLEEKTINTVEIVLVALIFIIISPVQYFKHFNNYNKENLNRTVTYSDTINSIVSSTEDPSKPIFLESYSVWDYELLVSVNRFLRAKGVENPMYINVNGYSIDTFNDPFSKKIAEEIIVVSTFGGNLAGEVFVPRSVEIAKIPGCLTLNFSGITEDICKSFIIR